MSGSITLPRRPASQSPRQAQAAAAGDSSRHDSTSIGQLEQRAAIVPLTAGKYHGAGENAVGFEIQARTDAIQADPGRLKIFGSNQISRGSEAFGAAKMFGCRLTAPSPNSSPATTRSSKATSRPTTAQWTASASR